MNFKKRPHPKANPTGAAIHGCASAREAIGLARIRLLKKWPLFGIPAFKLNLVETDQIPTTAVDARGYLYFNAEWINGMSLKDIECEVAHEIGHIITSCFNRFPAMGSPPVWNLANDQIIDVNFIHAAGIPPSAIMTKMSLTPEVMAAAQKDQITEVRYRNLLQEGKDRTDCPACKKIMEALMNGPEGLDKKEQDQGKGEEEGQGQGEGETQQEGQGGGHQHGDGQGGEPQHTCDNGRGCVSGALSSFQNLPADQQAKNINQWKQSVLKGAQLQKQKGQGNLPGSIEDWLAELVKPQVSWKDHIRACVHRTCNKANWSYRRPSRRGQALGMTLPGRDVEMSGVVVAIDTSGSISKPELNQFVSEITGIMEQCRVGKVTVIMHDCVVYHVGEYSKTSIRKLPVQSGGTSHVPVFDYIYEEMRPKDQPKVLICFTDLMTSHHPVKPKFPVLWCVFEDYASYGDNIPYGKIVSIPERSNWS